MDSGACVIDAGEDSVFVCLVNEAGYVDVFDVSSSALGVEGWRVHLPQGSRLAALPGRLRYERRDGHGSTDTPQFRFVTQAQRMIQHAEGQRLAPQEKGLDLSFQDPQMEMIWQWHNPMAASDFQGLLQSTAQNATRW